MTNIHDILLKNRPIYSVIEKMANIDLPNYYIGAGCITQTVWNYQCGFNLMHGISDIDLVYYDASDLSYEAEDATIKRVKRMLEPCELDIDIKNQARVHLWYREHNGFDIAPYDSVESAISSWSTMATAIGVRLENESLRIYAPFGIDDLFNMVLRPNKSLITEEIYLVKVQKWCKKWPSLTVVPW